MLDVQYIKTRHTIACYSHLILKDVVDILQEDYLKVLFAFYSSNAFYELEKAVYNSPQKDRVNIDFYKKKFLKEWRNG